MISASAVGYYGDRGAEILTEKSSKGRDYLADLCSRWEDSAYQAEKYGVRVCTLRLGIVLGREGGILKQVMPGFEMGLGTYTGSGYQKVPWVHFLDVVRAIEFCISDERVSGPINVTSPYPCSSKEFALELGKFTGTKLILPVSSFPLKLLFGEGSKVLTNSQNAIPEKLLSFGFEFLYESLKNVFEDELNPESVTIERIGAHELIPNGIKGDYRLRTEVSVKTAFEETFNFFSSPLNLGLSTPSWVGFKIEEIPHEVKKGSEISYRIKIGPIPLRWKTVIWEWNPNDSFIDFQEKGPYKMWHHEHQIIPSGSESSIMKDSVTYTIPGGLIGRVIHFLFIKKTLIRIFGYRRRIIQLRFGSASYV
jgi:ligand-binding SRPBCC domain-containing protein